MPNLEIKAISEWLNQSKQTKTLTNKVPAKEEREDDIYDMVKNVIGTNVVKVEDTKPGKLLETGAIMKWSKHSKLTNTTANKVPVNKQMFGKLQLLKKSSNSLKTSSKSLPKTRISSNTSIRLMK